MKSTNFEFLSPRWSELVELGAFAEAYTFNDPTSAIIKLRLFAENMTKDIYRDLKLPRPEQLSFIDYLTNDTFKTITPKVVLNKFHSLRINGNKAARMENCQNQIKPFSYYKRPLIWRDGSMSNLKRRSPKHSKNHN